MMKSFATLAMGLTFCLAASAAPVREVVNLSNPMTIAQADMTAKMSATPAKTAAAPMKIASLEDICGDYDWSYYNMFDPAQTPAGGDQVTPLVISLSDEANTVVITGYYDLVFKATVDLEANTITFKKQFAFVASDSNKDVYLTPYCMVRDEKGQYSGYEEVESIYGTIEEDGISFNEDYGLGLPAPGQDGSFFGPLFCRTMQMLSRPVFTYNPEEWRMVEEPAQYTDGWISWVFTENGQPITYPVQIAVNKKDQNKILLVDPYGNKDIWGQLNLSTTPGYILLDVANPDLVMASTRVYSGFAMDGLYQDAPDVVEEFYNFNLEAYLSEVSMVSDEEIEERFFNNGIDASYMEDNVITIYNCYFGFATNKIANNWWGENVPSEVILPEGWNGVEGIEADSNAPVKFYNLQGVEIANPEKGQLVIKKQGSKAQKMIVK